MTVVGTFKMNDGKSLINGGTNVIKTMDILIESEIKISVGKKFVMAMMDIFPTLSKFFTQFCENLLP